MFLKNNSFNLIPAYLASFIISIASELDSLLKNTKNYMSLNSKGRDPRFEFLRVLCAFTIVWDHVAQPLMRRNLENINFESIMKITFLSFTTWPTLPFVMLSGHLMIPKSRKMTAYQFISARLPKLIVPTLSWTIIYVTSLSFLSTNKSMLETFKILMAGNFNYLWFVYMLCILYVCTPLLQNFIDRIEEKSIFYFIALLTIIPSFSFKAYPFSSNLILKFMPYVGFYIAGYIMVKYADKLKIKRQTAMFLTFASGFSMVFFSVLLVYFSDSGILSAFITRINPFSVIMAICIFYICLKSSPSKAYIILAQLTPGIYFSHMIWILLLNKLGLNGDAFGPMIGIPLTAFSVFILSTLTTLIIYRYDKLKAILA